MTRTLGLASILAIVLVAGAACAASETASTEAGLIPPPAISIPYGGKIVTEINLSDNDVLGIIKQIIPAIGEVVGSVAPMAAKGPVEARAMGAIKELDFKGFADAISGITNVRLLVVKYGLSPQKPELLKQLDAGVAKLGKFSRVLSDVAMMPGVLALYAEADGGGYVGYAFDTNARSLYAARIVGSADVTKLTKWVADAFKLAFGVRVPTAVSEQPPSAPAPEISPDPAAVPQRVTP